MTESFAREHFAQRIKIGWLGLNLSKEQTQIPLTNTLWFSLEVLVSSGGRRYFSFMPLTSEAIQHINWNVEDFKQKSSILRISCNIFLSDL